jgi:succinate dehydrogenase / fumarate reductase iron-sulfur subunit
LSELPRTPTSDTTTPVIDVAAALAEAEGASMSFRVRVQRHDGSHATGTRRWDEFRVAWRPGLTVHDCLESILRDPVDVRGRRVDPPAWEASCLEGRCGTCAMRVDGRARQACTTLVDPLLLAKGAAVIELSPLSKLPVLRDLVVDRARIRSDLERVRAWVELDAGAEAGGVGLLADDPAPACTSCGACLDACPEVHARSSFVGAATIHEAHAALSASTARDERAAVLDALAGPGGVAECGRARNCVEVCPAGLPLDTSIAAASRATTVHVLTGFLRRR